MHPTSRYIYEHLKQTLYPNAVGKFIPLKMEELEQRMGVGERGLQSEDGSGPLQLAQKEIFRELGLFLLTKTGRGGGVMLTKDVELFRIARNQRAGHIKSDQIAVDQMDSIIRAIEMKKAQSRNLPLFNEDAYLAQQVEAHDGHPSD